MAFTSFEVCPLVNTTICHLCFGTGKVRAIQKKRLNNGANNSRNDSQLSCQQCMGKGVILGDLLFVL